MARDWSKMTEEEWWEEYRSDVRKYRAASGKARRKKKLKLIEDAKNKPCADCGVQYPPRVMDLHHKPGESKLFAVGASGARKSLTQLIAEIAKCEVLCANCHRMRH